MAAPAPLLLAAAGGRRFAFRLADVLAVLPLPRLTRPPSACPPPLLGLADIGGEVTPVLAPATLLGDPLPVAIGIDAHLLLLRTAYRTAVAVDRAAGIRTGLQPRPVAPAFSANGWLAGEVDADGETFALVAVDRLLVDAEAERLAAIAAAVAARAAAAAA